MMSPVCCCWPAAAAPAPEPQVLLWLMKEWDSMGVTVFRQANKGEQGMLDVPPGTSLHGNRHEVTESVAPRTVRMKPGLTSD